MHIPFPKHYYTPLQSIELLKNRGLQISDETTAQHIIRRIGYYRFSAYLYPLLAHPKENQKFKTQSSFETAVMLYRFDNDLRNLLFQEISKIEIAIRSAVANITAAQSGDIFWITTQNHFANQNSFNKTMTIIEQELAHSKEDFIKHFKSKYSNPYPPAWMLVEILPMGTLNFIYGNLANNSIRKQIAAEFSLTTPVFNSWLTIMVLTRNAIYHHARIWNKENAIAPAIPRRIDNRWLTSEVNNKRIFYNICIIKWFIDSIVPGNNFRDSLLQLLSEYPLIDIRAMGFPDNWINNPLWQE